MPKSIYDLPLGARTIEEINRIRKNDGRNGWDFSEFYERPKEEDKPINTSYYRDAKALDTILSHQQAKENSMLGIMIVNDLENALRIEPLDFKLGLNGKRYGFKDKVVPKLLKEVYFRDMVQIRKEYLEKNHFETDRKLVFASHYSPVILMFKNNSFNIDHLIEERIKIKRKNNNDLEEYNLSTFVFEKDEKIYSQMQKLPLILNEEEKVVKVDLFYKIPFTHINLFECAF